MTLELSLNNFRCWESKSISIPSSGICLINGRSGKGKSTILNSILYAVTGKLKNITTINKKTTKVSLKIDNISITRSRGPNRLIVDKDGKTYDGEQAQSIIDSIFGSEFANTSYIDQDSINSFVSLSPSDKMEFLEKLLLQQYDIEKIKDNIKIEISKTKTEYTSQESKLNTLESIIKDLSHNQQDELIIEKVKINKGNYQKHLEKIKSNYDVIDKNTKTVKSKLKKLEEEQNTFSKINEKKQKLNILLDDIKSNPLYNEIENITSIENELCGLDRSKTFYLKNKEYTSLKYRYDELNSKYIQLYEKNEKELHDLEKQLSQIPQVSKKRISELERCIEMIEVLNKMEQELNESVDFDSKIQEETLLYNSSKDILSKKQQILSEYEKCYTCPSCQKILKINNDRLVLSSFERDIDLKMLKQEIESLKSDIKTIDSNISSIKKQQTIYQQKEQQYNDMFDKLDTLRGDIDCDKDLFQSEINNINDVLKSKEEINKKIQIIKQDNLINDIKSELKNISLKLEKQTVLDKSIENHINNDKDYELCVEKMTYISEKLSQIKSLNTRFKNIYCEFETLGEINNKNYTELISTERDKLETYSCKIDSYKLYIDKLNNWERIEKENDRYFELKNSIDLCSENKQKLSDRLRCLVKLREHVKNAEQKCISDFISSLNEHASIYIEQFFPDEDIKVELKTIQESKTTGKEKISLNFDLTYRQIHGDLSYLSGGERDRINLAFTLAFSEIINNRVLLLDECISSLDAETTSIVLENLKEKYKGKLVILVSHQANLGFFDKVINI